MRAAWNELTAEHRRWLLINAVIVTAIINGVISAFIAWVASASEDEVALWAAPLVGGPSTIVDTVATLFILPFITTLILTTVAWHEMRQGKLAPLLIDRKADPLLGRMPAKRLRRAAYFGVLTLVTLAPLCVVLLIAFDYGDISTGDFVLYKTIFGILLGLVVTPPICIAAMTDREVAEVARAGIEPATP